MGTYQDNGPSGFKVVLPTVYEMRSNEWEVALVGLLYPHSWVNMAGPTDEELKAFRHQGVFKARISEARRPKQYKDEKKYPDALWVTLHIPKGNYQTVGELFKGMRQALRNQFGDVLADEEFQFEFDDDNKLLTLSVKSFSALGINPWVQKMLEEPFKPINASDFYFREFRDYESDDRRFLLLGNGEPLLLDNGLKDTERRVNPTRKYRLATTTDKVIGWRVSHFAFQTIYIYSDMVSSQVVGHVEANLLRVDPKGKPGDIVDENFVNPYCNDVRLRSFNTIEILLRGDTDQPVPFRGGVLEVTLHFRKK